MSEQNFTDEQLNLFIDNQLDTEDNDQIRHAMAEDALLRERICQLRAVRELVGYAYENVPAADTDAGKAAGTGGYPWTSVAAGFLVIVSALTGWVINDVVRSTQIATAEEVFQYYKAAEQPDRAERKIILHVTTGDVSALSGALDEAEQLLASYREAGTPMKLDIVTYREGINMLRVGVSPYVKRIEQILDDNQNVSLYACLRSIDKAQEKEGRPVVMMEKAITSKTAQELISERLQKGWIYIKV